ncbi:MAG: DUF2892 domain-containing protein [Geodermatophilaceae bacterium]
MVLLLTAFVGLNLLQSSITGSCPAALIYRRLGISGGCAFKYSDHHYAGTGYRKRVMVGHTAVRSPGLKGPHAPRLARVAAAGRI